MEITNSENKTTCTISTLTVPTLEIAGPIHLFEQQHGLAAAFWHGMLEVAIAPDQVLHLGLSLPLAVNVQLADRREGSAMLSAVSEKGACVRLALCGIGGLALPLVDSHREPLPPPFNRA